MSELKFMMGDYVKQTLEAIRRVEAQFKPQESSTTSNNVAKGNYQGSDLLSQLDETNRVLNGLKSTLEGHKPVHRELYYAVVRIETSAKEWWNLGMHNDGPVLAKWREYFLEFLLAVRWWTMVAALQEGEKFIGSKMYDNMLLKDVSQVFYQSLQNSYSERHFPSYGFEIWRQEPQSSSLNEILQWKIEFGNILGEDEDRASMALEAIRNVDLPAFVIEGMLESYLVEATSPLIEEEVIVDLTRDVLGVSRTGSWVIRTKYQGVDYALKRVGDGDNEQPVIARLSHPQIVQLMHYWRKDEAMFLLMELMEGDLTDLLSRHKRANESLLSLSVVVDIMLQTAKGLLYLHDLDITYPHLNCSNVLFRKSDTLQDGYIEYIIKLSGGGYSMKDDSRERKTQDVYHFGSFCLEVLTGRRKCEDLLDIVADTRPSIPEGIPPILKFCIASCFEGNLQFGFGQVVTLLLLAQYQVLKSQKDEAFLSFASKDCETVQLNQPDCAFPSTSDADLEKYPIHQLYPESDVSGSDSNPSTTIIFFHGFAKSPDEWKSTWMTRNREHVWPKVWLPEDLPGDVRILSVSYDTDASEESQEIGAIEIGKNVLRRLVLSSKWNLADPEVKVILIGHSFGGLIIKSLVVEAQNLIESQMEPRMAPKVELMMEHKREPKVEPKMEPKMECKVEPKMEPKLEPELEEFNIQPKMKSKMEPELEEFNMQSKMKSKMEPELEKFNMEPKMKSKMEPELEEFNMEPKMKSKMDPELEEFNMEFKMKFKMEPELEEFNMQPKMKSKMEPKMEPKLELNMEPQIEQFNREPKMELKMEEQLVKKCLNFLENLKGIVFYSVPGSANQDQQFEQYIIKLNQTGILQRSSLMQALLKDKRLFNQQMQVLGSQFEQNVPKKTEILGFIEGKGMRRIREKQVVVSDSSAKAQLKADFCILEEDNHFEVCRPVSTDHKGYRILVDFLKSILEIGSLNPSPGKGKRHQSEAVPDDYEQQKSHTEADLRFTLDVNSEFRRESWGLLQVSPNDNANMDVHGSDIQPLQAQVPIVQSQQIASQSIQGSDQQAPSYFVPTVAARPIANRLFVSADGNNWQISGQKLLKGSQYPRRYYKCGHLNCPTKMKVDRLHDGQVSEIVYNGDHNHSKPQPTRPLSLSGVRLISNSSGAGFASITTGNAKRDSSDVSRGQGICASGVTVAADQSSPLASDDKGGSGSKQSTEDGDDDEPDSKRRKKGKKVKDPVATPIVGWWPPRSDDLEKLFSYSRFG